MCEFIQRVAQELVQNPAADGDSQSRGFIIADRRLKIETSRLFQASALQSHAHLTAHHDSAKPPARSPPPSAGPRGDTGYR